LDDFNRFAILGGNPTTALKEGEAIKDILRNVTTTPSSKPGIERECKELQDTERKEQDS